MSGPPSRDAAETPERVPTVLVVDDVPANRRLLADLLAEAGHRVELASDGAQALACAARHVPDLVLLDVLMPGIDGFETCRRLRELPAMQAVPIVMVTSLERRHERLRGLDAGADDFLTKPVDQAELRARVKSLLRVKALYDQVSAQRAALDAWAHELELRVAQKVQEVESLSRLKRFFSPRLAERLVGGDAAQVLRSHRREVSVLFADLRGFTAFAEAVSADEVMAWLGAFHAAMGELVFRCEGTLERFTGDGMMVFFNDPDPMPDHALRAVRLGQDMVQATARLVAGWRGAPPPQGLGVGVCRGVATLGAIGFDARVDYAAIGGVTNLAARLCTEARAGEVLLSESVWQHVQGQVTARPVDGGLALRGFAQPVPAWRVVATG